MLSASIAEQRFETVTRRNAQIVELLGRIECEKLGSAAALNLIGQTLNHVAGE